MNLRLAKKSDVQRVKTMYKEIVDNMDKKKSLIWDKLNPCEFFNDDIEAERLYLLEEENNDIVAAFALCESKAGESYVKWENADAKALYMDHLGVNDKYLEKGIERTILKSAIELTKQKGAMYLRVLALDIKKSSNLHLENDVNKLDGVCDEVIDAEHILRKYVCEFNVENSIDYLN